MRVGDLVYIPFINDKGTLKEEGKDKDGRPLWEVQLKNPTRVALIYEKFLVNLEEIKFTNFRR